ncbi:MAG: hypothetical protein Hyperionvirus3_20 [Hyperionvirus sp.]|uniref:Leucine-rich repeat protein n=1 Tax=Hyperionvirus sp. TaxID=2487770 RepID=A0A3G5A8Q1_9VIRU|nr:MAG: hypothetical protein Hyperionvirus3_20 [Hyperionvirus sp.]
MKARRIVGDNPDTPRKAFTHFFSRIPPETYLEYFEILELVILKRTHRFFSENKIRQSAAPIIHVTNQSDCKNLLAHFPKAKLIIAHTPGEILRSCDLRQLSNIISLNFINVPIPRSLNFSTLPKLTVLRLDICYGLELNALDNMTQLIELSLNFEVHRFKGSTLRKLTNLTKLSLCQNDTITDADIESLPLRSLCLDTNRIITPFVLKRLNLTQLNITKYATRPLTNVIVQCTTITDLTLAMSDIDAMEKKLLFVLPIKVLNCMTWLNKLTLLDPGVSYGERLKYLTNLTHLELIGLTTYEQVNLPSLQTLIINAKLPWVYVPSESLTNLTHLEIGMVAYLADTSCLINLTYLKVSFNTYGGGQIHNLPHNLKTLILINLASYHKINFVRLENLTTLEIFAESAKVIHHLPVHRNLRKLTLRSPNTDINDSSLMQYTSVNHLSLSIAAPLIGYCFEYMKGLFSLTIDRRNISDPCVSQLRKRGIIVRH